MVDHSVIAHQITEFDNLFRDYGNRWLGQEGISRIIELLDVFEEHCAALVVNERRSLILLQRLQNAVGYVISNDPGLLFGQGVLEKAVRISPDPTQLSSAIDIGLFELMRDGDKKKISMGMKAIELGGVIPHALKIISNGYGLTKDEAKAFVPWKGSVQQQKTAHLATEILTGLLANTLEYSYTMSYKTLADNFREVLGGLIFFGGEPGCHSALDHLPVVMSLMKPLDVVMSKEAGLEHVVVCDDQASILFREMFDQSPNSNVLYALREHNHDEFEKFIESWDVIYQMGNAIKGDHKDFDFRVLPAHLPKVKDAIVSAANEVFNGDYAVDLDRANRLLKILRHFGLRGEDLRIAVTNSHISNMTQWILDMCLSGLEGESMLDVRPRDSVTRVLEFGETAPALYASFLREHRKSQESLTDFIEEHLDGITRNSLILAHALKDPRVKEISAEPVAMDAISAVAFYNYGADVKKSFGLEREYFSDLEVIGLAAYVSKKMSKNESEAWRVRFEPGLKADLERCAEHPRTKAAIGLLAPESRKHFGSVFNDWFTKSYQESVAWTDHGYKSKKLERDLGM